MSDFFDDDDDEWWYTDDEDTRYEDSELDTLYNPWEEPITFTQQGFFDFAALEYGSLQWNLTTGGMYIEDYAAMWEAYYGEEWDWDGWREDYEATHG